MPVEGLGVVVEEPWLAPGLLLTDELCLPVEVNEGVLFVELPKELPCWMEVLTGRRLGTPAARLPWLPPWLPLKLPPPCIPPDAIWPPPKGALPPGLYVAMGRGAGP